MKITLVILTVFVSISVCSQSLIIRQNLEQTYYSPKIGTYVGIEMDNGAVGGGFYQSSRWFVTAKEVRKLPRRFERKYFGVFMSYPVWSTECSVFKLDLRAGMLNDEKMLVTPSFIADYSIFKMVRLGFGVGVRAGQPAFQTSISFILM